MTAALGSLVSGDELRSAYNLRAKRFDEKTVTAASVKALEMKREAEEHDGWVVAKQNKRSIRMQKAKPVDRQLEDDVWSSCRSTGSSRTMCGRSSIAWASRK